MVISAYCQPVLGMEQPSCTDDEQASQPHVQLPRMVAPASGSRAARLLWRMIDEVLASCRQAWIGCTRIRGRA